MVQNGCIYLHKLFSSWQKRFTTALATVHLLGALLISPVTILRALLLNYVQLLALGNLLLAVVVLVLLVSLLQVAKLSIIFVERAVGLTILARPSDEIVVHHLILIIINFKLLSRCHPLLLFVYATAVTLLVAIVLFLLRRK